MYWLFYKFITALNFSWPLHPYWSSYRGLPHPYFISLHPTKPFSIPYPERSLQNANLNVSPLCKIYSQFFNVLGCIPESFTSSTEPGFFPSWKPHRIAVFSSHSSLLQLPATLPPFFLLQMPQAPFQFTVLSYSASSSCKTTSQSFCLRNNSSFFNSQLKHSFSGKSSLLTLEGIICNYPTLQLLIAFNQNIIKHSIAQFSACLTRQ